MPTSSSKHHDKHRDAHGDSAPPVDALSTVVRSGENWLTRRAEQKHAADIVLTNPRVWQRWRPQGRMARWSRRLAAASESSPIMQRFGRAAAELARLREHGPSFAVGVTATNEKNGHPYTAIGLAMTWARWGHRTLLVCTGGRFNEFGPEFSMTSPSIADLFEALSEGRRLPIPPILTPVVANLEVLSGMGHLTVSRLAETDWLSLFAGATRTRYDRVVWSLPPMSDGTWSPAMFLRVIDAITLSVQPGRTSLQHVRQLAHEVEEAGMPPVQVVWQT